MKKLSLMALVLGVAFGIQSCNTNKDSKETADSLNASKDSTGNVAATGGIAVDDEGAAFATKAAVAGMAEVEFSKLALTKTQDEKIKNFADMMVKDHGKANEDLKAVAAQKNITLPPALDEEHQKKLNDLQTKSGRDFDEAYVNAMVDGHEKTYDLLQDEIKDGKDQDLMAFASKVAPTVKGHLDLIKKMKDGMK